MKTSEKSLQRSSEKTLAERRKEVFLDQEEHKMNIGFAQYRNYRNRGSV